VIGGIGNGIGGIISEIHQDGQYMEFSIVQRAHCLQVDGTRGRLVHASIMRFEVSGSGDLKLPGGAQFCFSFWMQRHC